MLSDKKTFKVTRRVANEYPEFKDKVGTIQQTEDLEKAQAKARKDAESTTRRTTRKTKTSAKTK